MAPIRRRPGRDDIRARLQTALGQGAVVGDDGSGPLEARWTNGPAPSSVLGALGDVPGWDVVAPPPGVDPPPEASATTVVLRRDLSDRALAVGVVRFQASAGRPWSSLAIRDHGRFGAIVDVDHPAVERSGYPVVDEMVDLLLAESAPTGAPPRPLPTPADELAWRLEAAGYDRLWAVAWSRLS